MHYSQLKYSPQCTGTMSDFAFSAAVYFLLFPGPSSRAAEAPPSKGHEIYAASLCKNYKASHIATDPATPATKAKGISRPRRTEHRCTLLFAPVSESEKSLGDNQFIA